MLTSEDKQMLLLSAEVLANELLEEFGLKEMGWAFKWDSAKERSGCCWYGKKLITLSSHYVLIRDFDLTEDTIRHEIAHAMAYLFDGHRGHGEAWKRWAVRCGAKPERCFDDATLPKAYQAVCAKCGPLNKFSHTRSSNKYHKKCGGKVEFVDRKAGRKC